MNRELELLGLLNAAENSARAERQAYEERLAELREALRQKSVECELRSAEVAACRRVSEDLRGEIEVWKKADAEGQKAHEALSRKCLQSETRESILDRTLRECIGERDRLRDAFRVIAELAPASTLGAEITELAPASTLKAE